MGFGQLTSSARPLAGSPAGASRKQGRQAAVIRTDLGDSLSPSGHAPESARIGWALARSEAVRGRPSERHRNPCFAGSSRAATITEFVGTDRPGRTRTAQAADTFRQCDERFDSCWWSCYHRSRSSPMGCRLTVGRLTLDQVVGVRIPAAQPQQAPPVRPAAFAFRAPVNPRPASRGSTVGTRLCRRLPDRSN
jgi:hypothetical protein